MILQPNRHTLRVYALLWTRAFTQTVQAQSTQAQACLTSSPACMSLIIIVLMDTVCNDPHQDHTLPEVRRAVR